MDQGRVALERIHLLPKLGSGDWLSEESAQGFRSLLPGDSSVRDDSIRGCGAAKAIVILAGVRRPSGEYVRMLRNHVQAGAWVIWERAASFEDGSDSHACELLGQFFGVCVSNPIRASSVYLRYRWPAGKSVRVFHDAAEVHCLPSEAVAEYEGKPVAMKRSLGEGGIVFLGSMLGPGIRAEEREAREIGRSILNAVQRLA
jgi:hypothetical protein